MKKQLLHLLIAATLALSAAAASAVPTALAPTLEQSQAAHLSAEVVSRFHYRAQPLDAAMSDKIFTRYLKSLDPEKFFFTQADIDVMSKQRSTLGKAILGENLSAPFAIFNLYAQRVSERFTFARSMTKEKFDFSSRESFMVDREKEAWPASVDELHTLWRKQVKNDWLRLKLAGVAAPQIAQTLNKRYDSALQEVTRVTPEEAFETFMNAYTMAIDPHTNYMGPRATQEFDIAMSLSLEGIGATMSQKGGYNTIREMWSPADRPSVPASCASVTASSASARVPMARWSMSKDGGSMKPSASFAGRRIRPCCSMCCRPVPCRMPAVAVSPSCARKSIWRKPLPRRP
ncbi:tail-specific penicillin-binding protein protease [Oxalobacteraceae bacterium IMCC9480]|nr:tail-specific penicillin-binding protein protease [Oxalobacteraceae bacterium IMCC9480]